VKNYLGLLDDVLTNGLRRRNRTGVDTLGVFGRSLTFNLSDGFPLVTSKFVSFKSVVHELLWMISGSTNVKYLQDNKVNIWNHWADENGDLGPLYGKLWRDYNGVDQLMEVVETLKTSPNDRRMVMCVWDPSKLPLKGLTFSENVAKGRQSLAPCHNMITFVCVGDVLNLKFDMRSTDVFLGEPYNVAFYGAFLTMMAQVTGKKTGSVMYTGADVHLYVNHLEQAKTQLTREPFDLPTLKLNPEVKNITDFKIGDFELVNYVYHEKISGKVAV